MNPLVLSASLHLGNDDGGCNSTASRQRRNTALSCLVATMLATSVWIRWVSFPTTSLKQQGSGGVNGSKWIDNKERKERHSSGPSGNRGGGGGGGGKIPPVVRDYGGWNVAIQHFREDFIALATELREQDEDERLATTSLLIDISPVYDFIDHAIDTFGVIPVYKELFARSLERDYPYGWYYKSEKTRIGGPCETHHGIGCTWYDLWWVDHYAGGVAADKLDRDGTILLDVLTQETVSDDVGFMDALHHIQEGKYGKHIDGMSFHAMHGFTYSQMSTKFRDISTYPMQLASTYCGAYDQNTTYLSAISSKQIGSECYHGFGHGVFMVVAWRQLHDEEQERNRTRRRQERQTTEEGSGVYGGNGYDSQSPKEGRSARIQIRPTGDFVLSNASFCEAYDICLSALPESWIAQKCLGGVRHSYKLMSSTLRFTSNEANVLWFDTLYNETCL